jgi:hypothetical protein
MYPIGAKMVRKTNPEFVEAAEEDVVVYGEPVVEEPVIAMATDANLVSARVKGTWTMFWSRSKFNFEDGKRYKLPKDLYDYLRKSGNIYDTL